ncbi:uncharacterized protein LOC131021151 [Salvia miltiorrhiza]|uniref:uncharacterized protein LOC131021151 n=1 Tax=Salvia miltiorrhiza TaxID=226208 RepID=UPI0025AD7427|nr:uncharacterized protein LOC131021151 [Salvia miltiorrhiza]
MALPTDSRLSRHPLPPPCRPSPPPSPDPPPSVARRRRCLPPPPPDPPPSVAPSTAFPHHHTRSAAVAFPTITRSATLCRPLRYLPPPSHQIRRCCLPPLSPDPPPSVAPRRRCLPPPPPDPPPFVTSSVAFPQHHTRSAAVAFPHHH